MRKHQPTPSRSIIKLKLDRQLPLEFKKLAESLHAIDRAEEPYSYLDESPDETTYNRRTTIVALRQIQNFLCSQRVISLALFDLIFDLEAVEFPGETRPIFRPAHKSGRKLDDKVVQGLKGTFAGIAYAQMLGSMSREQAVSWTARNIPPSIARRISSNPIYASTIKEWVAQYGCNTRIRRELKSATRRNEFNQFTKEKIDSDLRQRSYGKKSFLAMLRHGYECQAANKPFPFKEIIDFSKDEINLKILAMVDSELGETTPIIPKKSRVISSPNNQP